MTISTLYNELFEEANRLYDSTPSATQWIFEHTTYFNDLFEFVSGNQTADMVLYQNAVNEIIDSLESNDTLRVADIILYKLCKYIQQDFSLDICSSIETLQNNSISLFDFKEENNNFIANANFFEQEKLINFLNEYDVNNERIAIDSYNNIAIQKKDTFIQLNSFCNSRYAAETFLRRYELNKSYIVFIIGISNMSYIKYILQKVSQDVQIVIYEPDKDIFAINFCYTNMKELFGKRNISLFVKDVNDENFSDYISCICDNSLLSDNIKYIVSPPYLTLFKEECYEVVQCIMDSATTGFIRDKTITNSEKTIVYNKIMNIPYIINSPKISDLKAYLSTHIDLNKTPVIIAAAGPSLGKDIELLKKTKGKAFIIAVDTAIKMFNLHNILPDAIITVDAIKPKEVFDNNVGRTVPIFFTDYSVYDAVNNTSSTRIFYNLLDEIDHHYVKEYPIYGSGGSVSNIAFLCAKYIGFKNIIFIGLNLAFFNGQKHTSIDYEEKDLSEEALSKYTYVTGINGNKLLADKNFPYYIRDFENEIKKSNGEINFINCTMEGAHIKGAINSNFYDAINKYCKAPCDMEGIIKNVSLPSNVLSNTDIAQILDHYIRQCNTHINLFSQAKELYSKLCTCTNVTDMKKMNAQLKTLENEHSKNELLYTYKLLIIYTQSEKSTFLKSMYDSTTLRSSESDMQNQVRQTANVGIKLCDLFIKGAIEIKDIFIKCKSNYCDELHYK